MPLELVSARICPFVHRAWLTLCELGIPFELKEVSLTEKPEWFSRLYATAVGADASSNGKVPVLVDGPFVLVESAVVAEYLVNKFGAEHAKDTALSPDVLTAEQRARAQIFAEQVIPGVISGFYALLRARGDDAQAAATSSLLGSIERLSSALAQDPSGPFFAGNRLSLADVLVWPWIARFGVLQHYRAFIVPEEPRFAAFHAFVAAMGVRPAVIATQAEDPFYIDGYRSYAE